MPDRNRLSIKARLKSFVYAWRGIVTLLKTQHNAWIHVTIAALVIAAGISLSISTIEWCVVFLAMGLVLASEGFNTAIEHFADALSPEENKKIGTVKDVAAGAVLIAAFFAALVGLFIFVPKLTIFLKAITK